MKNTNGKEQEVEKELFEWVKASEELPTHNLYRTIARFVHSKTILYDFVEWIKTCPERLNEIEWLKPASQSHPTTTVLDKVRKLKAGIIHFATLDKMPTLQLLDREHLIAYIVTIGQQVLKDHEAICIQSQSPVLEEYVPPLQPSVIDEYFKDKKEFDDMGWTGQYSLCNKDILDFIIDLKNK